MATVNAQLENNNWVFGTNDNLNFANNTTTPTVGTTNIDGWEGCASVSDEIGQLLFYTNSETIYNSTGVAMMNGANINGSRSSTQGSIIIKKPGSCNKYYVFTAPSVTGGNINRGYYYSEIDMSLDNGLGAVTNLKNIPLNDEDGTPFSNTTNTSASERLTSYTNSSIDHTWVIVQHNSSFYTYRVDNNGVAINPTTPISPTMSHINQTNYRGQGNIKISPDGTRLAISYSYQLLFELQLFDFNINSGAITNGQIIVNSPGAYTYGSIYGVEFSPNSQLIYFTTLNNLFQFKTSNTIVQEERKPKPNYNLSELYQYRIGYKINPLILISSNLQNQDLRFGGIQRGIDDKIYISNHTNNTLSIINEPNNFGIDPITGCDFNPEAIIISQPWLSFPQWVYKSGANSDQSWPLNFGSTNPLHYEFLRKINAIETDDEGNIYVLSTNLGEQSAQLTALANGNDFTQGGAFLAKFNPCKELIEFRTFSIPSSEASYGYLHMSTDNSLYVSFMNSVYKINTQTLQEVNDDWSHSYSIHPVYHKKNIITDSFNNNLFYARDSKNKIDNNYILPGTPTIRKPLIAQLDSNSGLAQNYYEFNLDANQSGTINNIVAYNNNIYVSGTIYSTTSSTSNINFPTGSINIDHYNSNNNDYSGDFIAKLTLTGNTYTPIAIKQGGGKLLFNNSSNILYSVYNMDTQLGFPIIYNSTSSEIIAHSGDLAATPEFTINTVNKVSDLHLKEQENTLFLSFHSTASTPTFLRKYNAVDGSLIWEANETITGNNYMVSSQIETFNDNIYLTGLYKSELSLPQTNLPNSLNSTTDLFALQLKDLGTSFEYRTTTNSTNIGLTLEANNGFMASDKKENIFTVFPNPFQNTLNISATTKNKTYTINISDFVGTNKLNIMYNTTLQRNATLNTSKLTKGVYVLRIIENDIVVHTRKLIK